MCVSGFPRDVQRAQKCPNQSLYEEMKIKIMKLHALLGNAVISKKSYAHARSTMVMHNNERGECSPCTLVERKRKRYDNAVDVVVPNDPTDRSTERTAPPQYAHVQLGDVPRTLDPAEVEGEFRQHDGMVMVMMKLLAQGFA